MIDDEDLSRGAGDPDLRSNKWIGVDLPKVDKTSWLDGLSSRQAYGVKHMLPDHSAGNIDYEPRFDEDLEKED